MKILTTSYRLRISNSDKELINDLKKFGVKPTRFIRESFREKIQRDMPKILIEEQKRKELIEYPF